MANKPERKRGLGRGLSALMADVAESENVAAQGPTAAERDVPIEQIAPNPKQPRKRFDPEKLEELARSIRERGIIQPLIVRQLKPDAYEIVAGERRWRAAQIAQLHSLPVIVREYTTREVLEVAIIENIQRSDLNPIEEAMGYRQLMDHFAHTQEEMSLALGKSRSHIANLLRLLSLPEVILDMVREGKLSGGHARTLVTADDPVKLAKQIIAGGLSVRAAEALVKKESQADEKNIFDKSKSGKGADKDADTRALEGDLSANLGMKVSIDHAPGQESGKMVLHYKSLEDLDELCRILGGG